MEHVGKIGPDGQAAEDGRFRTHCPLCARDVPGELVEKNGDLYLRRRCACAGEDRLFWKNARLFRRTVRAPSDERLPDGIGHKRDWDRYAPFVTTLAVDVTNRCNLRCPVCVSSADETPEEEPTVEEIVHWLPDIPRGTFRPNVALIGGESTLRADLPDIVRAIQRRGFVVRLNSNGINLLRDEIVEPLFEAGLRWIILQFDGFSPEVSVRFRGHDYSSLREEMVRKLTRRGFLLHLAVMVVRGQNDLEVGDILRYAMETRGIRRVSFYPKAAIGRAHDGEALPSTHVNDVIEALSRTTGGDIRQEDFLAAKRLGDRVFRLTRNPAFRSRACIFPLILVRSGERLVPVNRFGNPLGLLRHAGAWARVLWNVRSIFDFDRGGFGERILFLNIERFYEREGMLREEALNCHHLYLTREGMIPFCLYNNFYRVRDP